MRYIDHLIPLETEADSLYFGIVVHRALEVWYGSFIRDLALETIDEQCKERDKIPGIKRTWQIARAMVSGYIDKYGTDDDWKILAVEKKFEGKIVNPATGAESRTFDMMGKVDLLADTIAETNKGLYVIDHKTLASWSEKEIEKLWMDTQMAVYLFYLRKNGYPVRGIIYNVLLKTKTKQEAGETEEEYKAKYEVACKKNKTGKSDLKQKIPETDEQFALKLKEWYTPDKFQRATVELPDSRMDMIQEEIWEITQQYLDTKSRDVWLRNTGNCYQYHRPCEYLPYCRSNFDEKVKMELFGISDTVHPEFEEWQP